MLFCLGSCEAGMPPPPRLLALILTTVRWKRPPNQSNSNKRPRPPNWPKLAHWPSSML